MADPISIIGLVASILQLVDFGTKTIARLREASERLGEVPRVFRGINIRLPLLINILDRIKNRADDLSGDTKAALLPVIEHCSAQVEMIDEMLTKIITAISDSTWRIVVKTLRSVTQERKVQAIDKVIKDYIPLLTLHQTSLNGSQLVTRPALLTPVFMVDFERDSAFVAREDLLNHINAEFETENRVALAGIGGVGKSQIAIEYCYRFKAANPQSHVFWVYAGTSARFHQAFEEIGSRLRVPGCSDPNVDKSEVVKKWLSGENSPCWLMMLDNADDTSLFYAEKSRAEEEENVSLARYLPVSPNGKILITTRDTRLAERLANRRKPLCVQPMRLEDAADLLSSKLPGVESLSTDSKKLLTELGFLPLAITQAAAFISENFMSIETYLSALHASDEEFKEFLGQDLVDPRRDGESENCIIRTWMLSFNQITRQKPRAAYLLSLMAVLDRQMIPKSLLRNTNEKEVDFVTALGTLQAFSLVSKHKDGEFFEMHRLVQLATKSWLEVQGSIRTWQEEALVVLAAKLPAIYLLKNKTECEQLLPHVQAVLTYTNIGYNYTLKRARLLFKIADFEANTLFQYNSSYVKALEAYFIFKSYLPDGDIWIAGTLRVLAQSSIRLGKTGVAEGYLREAWKTTTTEPQQTMLMQALVSVLIDMEEFEEAAKFATVLLEAKEKLYSQNDPATMDIVEALARIRREQGDYAEAGKLTQRVLAVYGKQLGPEHEDTLLAKSGLAFIFEKQDRFTEAETIRREVVIGLNLILGEEDIMVLSAVISLAENLSLQGRLDESIELYTQALKSLEKIFEKDHPRTLMIALAAGLVFGQRGDHAESLFYLHKALAGRQRVLGSLHTDVLNTIVLEHDKYHEYAESEPLWRRLSSACEQISGRNDPATL
ncbi:hypothetical protein MMC13_007359 [Lambiella insularis]|nr:hypothetical protein [Lambiella insularis]